MSKRSQESSSPVSPKAKAKACGLVSRHGVSVGQNSSSNAKSLEECEILSSGDLGRKKYNSRCCSVQHASVNREYGTENSGGLSETQASGNREYMREVVQNMKDRLGHDDSVSEISVDSEEMRISIWARFMASSMHAALHMDPSYEKNLEIFSNSEFEHIKGFVQYHENDDRRKFRN